MLSMPVSTNLVEAGMWIVLATVADLRDTARDIFCLHMLAQGKSDQMCRIRKPSRRFTVCSSNWTQVIHLSGKHATVPVDQSRTALFRRGPSLDLVLALISISRAATGCPSGDGVRVALDGFFFGDICNQSSR